MPLGTIISIGATLLGGYLSSRASNKAAKIQANAAQQGLNFQREQFQQGQDFQREQYKNALELYNQGRADLAPYRDTGAGAVTTLAKLYGIPTPGNPNAEAFGEEAAAAFRRSPDYKFAFDEGNRAVQFSAAAKGALGSGNTLRDLTTFGQGLATQNFGNYVQRLLALAGMGQGASTTSAGFGAQFGQTGMNFGNAAANQAMNFGNAAADQIANAGQARASGVVGSANAWNQALSGIGNNLAFAAAMNPGGTGGGWGGAYNLGGTPSLGLAA